jgi:hypothetical protein
MAGNLDDRQVADTVPVISTGAANRGVIHAVLNM